MTFRENKGAKKITSVLARDDFVFWLSMITVGLIVLLSYMNGEMSKFVEYGLYLLIFNAPATVLSRRWLQKSQSFENSNKENTNATD